MRDKKCNIRQDLLIFVNCLQETNVAWRPSGLRGSGGNVTARIFCLRPPPLLLLCLLVFFVFVVVVLNVSSSSSAVSLSLVNIALRQNLLNFLRYIHGAAK